MRFYITAKGQIFLRAYPTPNDMCKFYIRETVEKRYWSHKSQRVLSGHYAADQINAIIKRCKEATENTIREGKINGQMITSDMLKQKLRQVIFGAISMPTPLYIGVSTYTEHYIKRHKPSTAKTYKSKMRKILELFPSLKWEQITPAWRHMAIDHMQSKGYSHNYISKLLSVLKTVMLAAIDEGITTHTPPSRLVPTPQKVDTIYIPHDQIMRMYHTQYPHPYQTNAMRLWMTLYSTGQRISDVANILHADQITIKGVRMIRFVQQKTKKHVSIPFNDIMTDLWQHPPKIISDQKLNKYIKEVASYVSLPYAEQITSHTARRSCATNLVLQGVPISVVMDITGHTTERECRRYVRYDDISGAIRINENNDYLQLFSIK